MSTAPATAIIPARHGSTRFPGKVLADRTGKPMIQHVYQRAASARLIERVIVATDDRRVLDAVQSFGGEAVMTRAEHLNGSCRSAEVAAELTCDIIVNVQGDEPEIEPAVLDEAIESLIRREDCVVATIASPFRDDENPDDPDIVKVVLDQQQRAMYFSRSRIPFPRARDKGTVPLKHIGVYVYRRPFLLQYVLLPATPLEMTEQLEQLRILEHGYNIAVAMVEAHFHGIDTPQQYDAFVRRYEARASSP